MPRLLLIDPDRDALDALHAALRRAGFEDVTTVTSGAFALTTLERNRPDLIVSRAGVPDIDGYELCAIVRNDPSMTGVLFLLLEGPGDHAPAPRHEDKPDQVLAGDLPLATIAAAVDALLHLAQAEDDVAVHAERERPIEPEAAEASATDVVAAPVAEVAATGGAPSQPAAPEPPVEEEAPAAGGFEVMKLAEAMEEIVVGQKTGHLVLTLRSGRGVIVFERGKVVHTEFFGLIGEIAFTALLVAAHGEAQGSFGFEALAALPPNAMRTIKRDLKQLLLSAAVGIDEGRTDAAVAPVS
jgi:CheY-like chemotaxis protein